MLAVNEFDHQVELLWSNSKIDMTVSNNVAKERDTSTFEVE